MSASVGNESGFVFFQQSFVSVLFGSGYSSFAFIPFFIYKPVTVRNYNRISLSSHVAVMAEKKCSGDNNKGYWTKNERWEKKKKKNTYSSAHIPPHSVALSATQMMMYLEHCGGHQHVWRPTHLNCKIGRAC